MATGRTSGSYSFPIGQFQQCKPFRGIGKLHCTCPTVESCCLKKNLNAPRPSEHPPVRGKKCCCCCRFSHSAHWLPTRRKLLILYTVANPAGGLLNRGKKEEKKCLAAPPPRALLVRRKKKESNCINSNINKISSPWSKNNIFAF